MARSLNNCCECHELERYFEFARLIPPVTYSSPWWSRRRRRRRRSVRLGVRGASDVTARKPLQLGAEGVLSGNGTGRGASFELVDSTPLPRATHVMSDDESDLDTAIPSSDTDTDTDIPSSDTDTDTDNDGGCVAISCTSALCTYLERGRPPSDEATIGLRVACCYATACATL
jgi:hypothetical protein